uniref:M61 family metallopeptidase n=1 Tax=Ningiella ruwaisensis TaxID=2364274 RepID=UPI00109FFDA1|nr:PDZ domain-containing protein [Ningiella ruwaisensis]
MSQLNSLSVNQSDKAQSGSQADPRISYHIAPINLSEHIFAVDMMIVLPHEEAKSSLTLRLPAWIPGSYMIRDFARNIIEVSCSESNISILKKDKQTWELTHKQGNNIQQVLISYRVFAFDLSVRSAYLNHEYGFFNGTSMCLNVKGFEKLPHYVQLAFDQCNVDIHHWDCVTAMPISKNALNEFDNKLTQYCNPDYDTLIDHPVLLGELCKKQFVQSGVTFHVVFTGKETMDLSRICEDLKPICEHHIQLFGESPVDEYYFMTLLCERGFGGLEHKGSTVLQFSRFELPFPNESFQDASTASKQKAKLPEGYQQFLSLCSHELFHTWHVKRIKPKMMVMPDLSQESYTPQLWIYEGFTSLYDDLTLARTGIIDPQQYCEILGQNFTRLMRNPGRHLQSISESSFDAWTRFYKQDANSINHIVSYYLKGAIVALALDITIRQQTQNTHSLDDVMRVLWHEYGKEEIGTLDSVIDTICAEKLGINISSFLHVAVNTTMDLPFSSMINSIGLSLHMRTRSSNTDKGGKAAETALKHDIGASFTQEPLGLRVNQVLAGSAAAKAGIQLNDVIIACDKFKADIGLLYRQLNAKAESDCILLHLMRDHQLIELPLVLEAGVMDTCYLSIDDSARFEQWLGIKRHE